MNDQLVLDPQADGATDRRVPDRDHDLVTALRHRDPAAAECLVSRYGDRAYRLAVGITGNGHDAEEAVQEAFWTVIRKIDMFRSESAFGSWLYRIVANSACQHRRRRRRSRDVSLDDVLPVLDERRRHAAPTEDWSAGVDPSLQAELRLALTSAMDALPAAARAMLVLRDVEGLSNLEVAAMLGVSVPAVKTRVHRARLFLRRQLEELMTLSAEIAVASTA